MKAIEDLIRGMPAFSVVDEDDGWRQASQMQRRPQPRRITLGDFVATSVSNKFGMLKDSNDEQRHKLKCPRIVLESLVRHEWPVE